MPVEGPDRKQGPRPLTVTRTYTYRCLRIRKPQREQLDRVFRHLTWVYNQSVAFCRERHEAGLEYPGLKGLSADLLTPLRKEIIYEDRQETNSWLDRQLQSNTLKKVDRSYQVFFKSVKDRKESGTGRIKGRPRFKPMHRGVKSFESSSPNHKPRPCKNGQYEIRIKAVHKGRTHIKLRFNDLRDILSDPTAQVRRIRIVKHQLGTGYDVQLIVERSVWIEADDRPLLGVDLGLRQSITLSNGTQYKRPRAATTKARKAQQRLSRAKLGSNSRKKKRLTHQKEQRRLKIRRRNAIHQLSAKVIRDESAWLGVVDFSIANMMRTGGGYRRSLNRELAEEALDALKQQLTYKAESAGGEGGLVDPKDITQRCSVCGGKPEEKIGLDIRIYQCAHCGLSMDRDHNAAINVRTKAEKVFDRLNASPVSRSDAKENSFDDPRQTEGSPILQGELAWRTSITFHTNLHAPAKPASFFVFPRLPGNNLYVMLRYAPTVSAMGTIVYNSLSFRLFSDRQFLQLEKVMGRAADAHVVFHQERNQLFAVHEAHGCFVRFVSFRDGSAAEAAGGNDQALLVRTKAAAHLLNDRPLNICFPAFYLNSHLYADCVADQQRTSDINTAIPAELGHLNAFKTHLCQKLPNESLKLAWTQVHQQG